MKSFFKMYTFFLLFALITLGSSQTLTKLQWSTCPGVTNVIDIFNFDATPMVTYFNKNPS